MYPTASQLAETQQRNLLKQIALIGFGGTVAYIYLFVMVWQLKWVGIFDFFCSLAYLFFYYKAHTAKIISHTVRYGALQFFIVQISVICFVFLGRDTGLQFYLLSVAMAVLLVTPLDRSWNKYLSTTLSLALFFTIELSHFEGLPIYSLDPEANRFLYLSTIAFSCFGLGLISYHVTLVLRQSHETLRHSSITDELTGINNRRFLFERFKQIEQSGKNSRYSVMVIDVDHFKSINDTYGHAIGDKVLKRISDKLIECFPTDALVCRIGGEEFCVVVEQSSPVELEKSAEFARKTIDDLSIYTHRHNLQCTVSIGLALGSHERSMSSAMSNADQALYEAKQGGRNQVISYLPSQSLTA
jgi:diguanylate cyclase (GGDEF)-like protein